MDLVLKCPHCKNLVIIEQLNCSIFRHASLKSNGNQINPHASLEECLYLINNNLINGCGKPFSVHINNGRYEAIKCSYSM